MEDKDHDFIFNNPPKGEEEFKKILDEELSHLKFKDLPCPECGRKMKPISAGIVCRYCHIVRSTRGDILKASENCNCEICTSLRNTIELQRNTYKVNEYLTLKLENKKITNIYVKGKLFSQCIRLILEIPKSGVKEYDEIDSIDEAAQHYDTYIHQNRILGDRNLRRMRNQNFGISAEQEFWGHCSNLQVWADNNYDTRILHRNIAFPLLKQLHQAGDPVARRVFKEEIAQRLESGFPAVVQYLINEGYLRHLGVAEIRSVIEDTNFLENLLKYNSLQVLNALHSHLRHIPYVFKTPLLKLVEKDKYSQFFPLLKFLSSKGYLREYDVNFMRNLFQTIMKSEQLKQHFTKVVWEIHNYYPEVLRNLLEQMMIDNEIRIFPKYLEEFLDVITINENIISESVVLEYIQSKGCNASRALINGKVLKTIIIKLLDKAIYRAKANGRNTVRGFDV